MASQRTYRLPPVVEFYKGHMEKMIFKSLELFRVLIAEETHKVP